VIEAAYELADPPSTNRDRLVGHYLGADPQTVSLGWINGNPEVWGIHDFRCHLANHDSKTSSDFGARAGQSVSQWMGCRRQGARGIAPVF